MADPIAADSTLYQNPIAAPPMIDNDDLFLDGLPSFDPDTYFDDENFSLDQIDFSIDDFLFADTLLVDPENPDSSTLTIQTDVVSLNHNRIPDFAPDIVLGGTESDVARVSDVNSYPLTSHESDVARVLEQGSNSSSIRVSGSVKSSNSEAVRVFEQESNSVVFQGSNSNSNSNSNSPSRSSGNTEPDVSSVFCSIDDRKLELNDGGNKRKKEEEEEEMEMNDENVESRMSKVRKSGINLNEAEEEDERKKARLMRNRESAQLSRQRKKQYVEELEDKVKAMHATITDLNARISFVMAENAGLRHQLSSNASGNGGICPPMPPPGMYPVAPMGYPWMPMGPVAPHPYIVKPQGSQVPLVPIPRLKPQQAAPAPKVGKKSEGRKSEGKTKKVASVTFLGLVFFMLLFGGLFPMVSVKYGGIGDTGFVGARFEDASKGKVLMFNGRLNGTHAGAMASGGKEIDCGDGHCVGIHCRRLDERIKSGSGGFGSVNNASEPLVASLYVPRNDKLVKIDGNLIIHSIMATEKVAAEGKKIGKETSLALAGNYGGHLYPIPEIGRSNVRHTQMDRDASGRHMALGSGSTTDELRSSPSDGKLQEWFREGLAGPMLSSGMCTEVFQFDVSPAPGAMVTAAPVANSTVTASHTHQNSTQLKKTGNRRILHGNSIPLNGRTLNVTGEHAGPTSKKDGRPSKDSRSSIIVNVLVDPREASDGDGEGIIGGAKSLSRIFVVVLIDSVKYVTYSCMLPRVGSGPQLVTA